MLAMGDQTLVDRAGQQGDAVPADLVAEVLASDTSPEHRLYKNCINMAVHLFHATFSLSLSPYSSTLLFSKLPNMATITGIYSAYSIQLDLLKGTTGDDLFIMGGGSEYAIGDKGVDVAQIPFSINSVNSAYFFGLTAVIVYDVDKFYYLDSIEKLEFSDKTIDLASLNGTKELAPAPIDSIISGNYSTYSTSQDLLTTNNKNYTMFLPGSGSANVIGTTEGYETVFIEKRSANIKWDFNGSKATAKFMESGESTITCRDVDKIITLDEMFFYDPKSSSWLSFKNSSYDLKNYTSNPVPVPAPALTPKNSGTASFSISGQGTVGSQLSIIKTNDDPEGNGKFTYQWQSSADGTNWTSIGTDSSLYTVSASDASKQIRSQITYVDGKNFSESVATSATKIAAFATAKVSAADFTTLASINVSLPAYTISTNWNIDKYYYYVEQYPMTLRTAFYADYVAGRATNEALWGQNHYLLYGQAEGRALPDTTGVLTDTNDYGAYVENYGTTLLDIYRKDPRAVLNGGTMSMFAWGKEHYTNWGKAEGREITGGVDWGAIVRNNLDLYNKWQDAKIVSPSLSAFAYGFQNQSTIKSSQNVFVGSDTSDKLTGQIVYGLNGNDVACSSGGTGILAGGFGDDLIVAANGGSDLAYGGPGSDIFQLNAGSSLNIRDFRKGADMIQLGSTLTSTGVTMQWDSADNSTYFYNGTSVIGKVYGKRPTDFTYSDSTNGVSKVYI